MSDAISDRRLDVLRAIVSDYVHTREPVGSKAIVERHGLNVSPATIRNDMAVLEEEGYIHQPHTSAGRIPTDKGYRLFVDRIASLKPLSPAERRAVRALFTQNMDIDELVHRTVRLLAQLTHQVAVVQYPTLRSTAVRHVELVPRSDTRLLVVVITDSGRVEQRLVDVEAPVDENLATALRTHVNATCAARSPRSLREALQTLDETVAPPLRSFTRAVLGEVIDVLEDEVEDRIVVGGTANLARAGIDFRHTITPVLEALEENVVLLRLFTEMDETALAVRIGAETGREELAEAALVTSIYGGEEAIARLGVIGPTRMDYPAAMTAVQAVARYLSRFLGSQGGNEPRI